MAGLILDASALLAMLQDESGAKAVADAIDQARMSTVNYAEVVSYYARLGADRRGIEAVLRPLPLELVPVNEALALAAGMMRQQAATHRLSLGDRFCLALARRDALPAWTADKTWQKVAETLGVEIVTVG